MRREWGQRLKVGFAVVLIAMVAVACGNGDEPADVAEAESTMTPPTVEHGTPRSLPTPTPVGPAPEASDIDTSSLEMIDEWRAVQVPRYPDAEFVEFSPETATETENAGIMYFMTDDSVEEVLGFYRAALPHLGWTETRADARRISAESDEAGLTVGVSNAEGGTNILMILSDPMT